MVDMKNNKGFSLVELLLAFAISAIMLTGLTYLIFTVLGVSGRSNANIMVQNEAQTTLNLMVDQIMEAQGVCMKVPSAGSDTECILLGDLLIKEGVTGNTAYFRGMALVTEIEDEQGKPVKEAYLVEIPNDIMTAEAVEGKNYAKLAVSTVSREDAAALALSKVYDNVIGLTGDERTKWLLAQHITQCRIELKRDSDLYMETVYYDNGSTDSTYYFKEPFIVHITLSFEYDYGKGIIDRTIEDEVAVRSRIKNVFVDKGDGNDMVEYKRK